MKKRDIIIYNSVTGLFTLHMLFTIVVYFANHEMVADMFTSLGIAPALIYPLAIAKLIGLIVIWSNKSRLLKELAYAAFAIDFLVASGAHLMANDGGFAAPLVALVILAVSFLYHRKLYGGKQGRQVPA